MRAHQAAPRLMANGKVSARVAHPLGRHRHDGQGAPALQRNRHPAVHSVRFLGADWLRPNRAWCSHGKPCLILLQGITLSEVSPNVSPVVTQSKKANPKIGLTA
jgi:hypothetical protein